MAGLHALLRSLAAIAIAAVVAAAPAPAQQPQQEYVPEVGQDGKDVVWVPSELTMVDKMLDMASVTPADYLIDLGSGDGRTVIAAARRGAKAHGIEFNGKMVELSKRNAQRAGVSDKATFVEGDIFATDFSQATVLTLFLLPEINLVLRPLILNMKPGTRVVSNTFDMGNWTFDETVHAPRDCKTYCQAFLWIVPAKVEGIWELEVAGPPATRAHLELRQTHQVLSGALGGMHLFVRIKGSLKGHEITFTDADDPDKFEHTGEVKGDTMEGSATTRDGARYTWRATRAKRP
jgi:Methyltransferase domain